MTDDLVAWLRAQVDKDERTAEAAPIARLRAPGDPDDTGWPVETESGGLAAMAGSRPLAAHIARHDPARVLAEVAAKRRIIDEHALWRGPRQHSDPEMMCSVCVSMVMESTSGGGLFRDTEHERWPCDTLRLLASVYAGRPGWQSEWTPGEEVSRG